VSSGSAFPRCLATTVRSVFDMAATWDHRTPRTSFLRTLLLLVVLLAALASGSTQLQGTPETLLRTRPPPEINACSVRLTISSDASVWGYETKLNDDGWALGPQFKVQQTGNSLKLLGLIQQGGGSRTAKIVPHSVTGLPVGEHTLKVRAFDGAGKRDDTPAEVQWRVLPVDTIIVTSPVATALPHSPLSFEVRSSAAKWAYEYRLDGGSWHLGSAYGLASGGGRAPTPGAPFDRLDVAKHTDHTRSERQMLSSGAEGHHTLEVRAFNECGEVGPTAAASWRTTWVQTSSIQSPPNGTVSSSRADFVTEVGPSRPSFQWRLNDGPWVQPDATPHQSSGQQGVLVPLKGLSDGPQTLLVRALDYQGRADSEPLEFRWTVDTLPPVTHLRATPYPGQSPSDAAFQWSCEDVEGCNFRYRLDGGEWVDTSHSAVSLKGLSPGPHTISVTAVDTAGNEDPSPATLSWEVDTATPVTTIAQGPYKYTPERSAHFEFITSREGCSLRYSLNGGDYVAGAHSLGLYDLLDGQHKLRVFATDGFGRAEPSPAVYTWVVDTQPPETVVHQWFFSPEEPGVALFSVGIRATSSGSDPIFDYQYKVCREDGCSDWLLGPKSARMASGGYELRITGLTPGKYTVIVQASDRAGNTDPSPASIDIHYGDRLGAVPSQPRSEPSSSDPLLQAVAEITELSGLEGPAGHSRSLRHDSRNTSEQWPDEDETNGRDEGLGFLSSLLTWIMGSSDVERLPRADLRRRSLRREL